MRSPALRIVRTALSWALFCAVLAVWSSAAALAGPDRRSGLDLQVDRVLAYVEQFHKEMEGAVLDERYVQTLRKPCCSEPRNPGSARALEWRDSPALRPEKGIVERRQLLSEVLLVPVTGGMKVGYRDVFEVDGQPVRARSERMRRLFEAGTPEGEVELGKIAAESARFNIGPGRRYVNTPSLPLLYLAPTMRSRLYFSSGGRERREGRELALLEFREDGSPTLVAGDGGRDQPARGKVWVDPESGAIREIEVRIGELARRIVRVWFRDEPRMKVLVPLRMWEWYERIPIPGDAWPADLEALATYTAVKLFTVSTTEESGEPIQ
jgi:hypothetical protein